jgi:hypothetical protein
MLTGRHPTAIERALLERPLSGDEHACEHVGGNSSLSPERALVIDATCVWWGLLGGAGARGELARVLEPLTLDGTGTVRTPVNGHDETAAALTLWGSAGDTSQVSGSVTFNLYGVDADGALNASWPVPSISGAARVSVPLSLFDSYVGTHVTAELKHESGLSRGPWVGLVDDAFSTLSLSVTGTAGPSRFFVSLEDVLETGGVRVPLAEPPGRTLSAGFSWMFRN